MIGNDKTGMLRWALCLLLCVVLVETMVAQTSIEKLNQRMEELGQVVYQNPVAVKSELMDIVKNRSGIPDSTMGEVFLNWSIALGMTNQLDSGIWAAKESMQLLSDQSMVKASSLKTLAILYRLKGNWKLAEESILLSLQLNDSLWNNKLLSAVTLQEYASLSLDRREYFKATSLLLKALETIQLLDKSNPRVPYTAVKLRVNLAEAYAKCENYPFAIREFRLALPQLDSLNDIDGYVRAGLPLAEAYMYVKQSQSADSILKKLLPLAEQLQNDELKAYVLLYTGKLNSSTWKYDMAIPFYRDAFTLLEKQNSVVLPECSIGLLNALKETGGEVEAKQLIQSSVLNTTLESSDRKIQFEFKKAALPFIWKDMSTAELADYTLEIISLGDSVASDDKLHAAAQIQAEYQFERQEAEQDLLVSENEVLKEKERLKKKQLYLTLAISALVFAMLILLLKRLRQRSLEKDKTLQAKERELQFQREKREWAEKEKELREQLVQQQKAEIMRNVEDAAELRAQLEQLVMEQQQERRKELLDQFEKTKEEKKGLGFMVSQFNALHPTFASELIRKFPGLSTADVQFCTLCRMNLNTKEISTLLNIESRSVYVRKYRIIEKMGLSETVDFEKVLFGF
jgi:tetratricopeptide (TPR) repeat protein